MVIMPFVALAAGPPVAFWDFESGAGLVLVDQSGNGHHGAIEGGATWVPSGVAGGLWAIDFDGMTAAVTVPGDQELYPGNHSYAVSAWVQTSWSGTHQAVIHNQWLSNHDAVMLQVTPSGNPDWKFHDYNGTEFCQVIGSSVINDGEWHHLVGVRDRSNGVSRVYVDGSLDGETPDTNANVEIPLDNYLTIGRRSHSGERYFNGLIDQLQIFDEALTAADVLALYYAEHPTLDYECEQATIEFAGHTWGVACGPQQPGNFCFSSSSNSVWVDFYGRLHLRIRQLADGRWCQAGVWWQDPARYGAHKFFLIGAPWELDDQTVIGMFIYKDFPATNGSCPDNDCNYFPVLDVCVCEADVEITGAFDEANCVNGPPPDDGIQIFYVTQPENCKWFEFDIATVLSTHGFVWDETGFGFQSWEGQCLNPPCDGILGDWSTNVNAFPEDEAPITSLNLWTYRSQSEGVDQEVVFADYLGNVVFADDFESGDTSAWSATVP
jgi:hypothetical protein